MNNTKRTCKQMTGIGLAVLLLLVQCISGCGMLFAAAAEDSAFYSFDDFAPAEGDYNPPANWRAYSTSYDENNKFYSEDGALGYQKTYTGRDYNAGAAVSLPAGLDKTDFFIDSAINLRSYVTAPNLAFNNYTPLEKVYNMSAHGENKWHQYSVKVTKGEDNKFYATVYVDGAEKLTDKLLTTLTTSGSFLEFRITASTWDSTTSGMMDVLIDNVGIRKTPTELTVTPFAADGAENVPAAEALTYRLSQDMKEGGLDAVVLKDANGEAVACEKSYDVRTKTISLSAELKPSSRYTADLSAVEDVLGNRAANAVYGFTTQDSITYYEEDFESYTETQPTHIVPQSSYGVWDAQGVTEANVATSYVQNQDGAFHVHKAHTASGWSQPQNLDFTFNKAITAETFCYELDYKLAKNMPYAYFMFRDSRKSYQMGQWTLLTQDQLKRDNEWHRLTMLITNGSTAAETSAKIYQDGVLVATNSPEESMTWDGALKMLFFQPYSTTGTVSEISLDNLKITSIPTTEASIVASSLDAGASNLPLGAKVTFNFDRDIDAQTLANITVSDGVVPEISYNGVLKQAVLTFGGESPLASGSSYKVDVSGVRDVFGNALSGDTTYRFTTTENPTFTAGAVTITDAESGDDLTEYGFVGGTVRASVSVSSTKASDETVGIAVAFYKDGKLKQIAKGEKTVSGDGTAVPVSAELTVEDTECAGDYYVQVFAFKGFASLQPLAGSIKIGENGKIG